MLSSKHAPAVGMAIKEEQLLAHGSLAGRKILLAVTGSIAVYKSVALLRLLTDAGADVQVLMTKGAAMFVQPLTFSALSTHAVLSDFHDSESGSWNNHVALGLWADLMIIAPLSAHTLAKLVMGHCDNLLLATYLSLRCPVLLAPAMDADMYAHASTQENLSRLETRARHHILTPEQGKLASGLEGMGRLPEPAHIYAHVERLLTRRRRFEHLRILLTAGPTEEPMDPVRFIGNHSSGKMAFALVYALLAEGAQLELVLGPCGQQPEPHPALHCHHVRTAVEMHKISERLHPDCHVAIFVAAVADYRPKQVAAHKIKKQGKASMTLTLEQNPDIAALLGAHKSKHQYHIGFALETKDEASQARKKLTQKKFDLLVLNSLQEKGAGFGHSTNKVSFFYKTAPRAVHFELKTKQAVAADILDALYADYVSKKVS